VGDDPLGRAAGALDGAWAMLTGVAANRSFATGVPVFPSELLPGLSLPAGAVARRAGP